MISSHLSLLMLNCFLGAALAAGDSSFLQLSSDSLSSDQEENDVVSQHMYTLYDKYNKESHLKEGNTVRSFKAIRGKWKKKSQLCLEWFVKVCQLLRITLSDFLNRLFCIRLRMHLSGFELCGFNASSCARSPINYPRQTRKNACDSLRATHNNYNRPTVNPPWQFCAPLRPCARVTHVAFRKSV